MPPPSALAVAIQAHEPDQWRAWLRLHGTTPPQRSRPIREAIQEAVSLGRMDALMDLVPHAYPSDVNYGLCRAAGRGWLDAVRLLLPHADAQALGSEPMLAAVARGRVEVMAHLWQELHQGSIPEQDGRPWLLKAVERQQREALVWLAQRLPVKDHAPALVKAAEQKNDALMAALSQPQVLGEALQILLMEGRYGKGALKALTPHFQVPHLRTCLTLASPETLPTIGACYYALVREAQLADHTPAPTPARYRRRA